MREAETVLEVIRERGKRGLPLERIYRLLFNRELYLRAYGRLYRNSGAMTQGSTSETVDGMSLAKIDAIIDAVAHERYRWTPVRRTYIEKKNSTKLRTLGIPTWSDKLLQEVIRSILDAYYEPQFSPLSHGFRPNQGCHTALQEIAETWTGTTWFIEGDITQCFDSIDHEVLLSILAEKLHDNRFLRLIANLLKAGYLEDWKYGTALSGVPQGGVVSPILSNIYLDKLDKFVEKNLLPRYNKGDKRKRNPAYRRLEYAISYQKKRGRFEMVKKLRRQMRCLPSKEPADPDYRRLRYVRYADDILLGFSGPRAEAEEIKHQLAEFLQNDLKLALSDRKTLITHARSQAARFLGYEITVLYNDTKLNKHGKRILNGTVGLKVPVDVIKAKCKPYLLHGKPTQRAERRHDSDYSIVAQYQAEYRGIVQYYQLAFNVCRFARLKGVMEHSLTLTLAGKHRTSVPKVYKKYGAIIHTPLGTYKGLRVVIERGEGKRPLIAEWGGIPLRRRKKVVLDDQPHRVWNVKTELLQRVLADTCEMPGCNSQENIEVHHVRALKDLQMRRPGPKPEWAKVMAARHRKTLVVCRKCHRDIHAGRPTGTQRLRNRTLESRVR